MNIGEKELPTEYANRIFSAFIYSVFSEGGDGDGLINCKWVNYKSLANQFEEYVKKEYNAKFGIIDRINPSDIDWERHDHEGYTIFQCRPEQSFCISNAFSPNSIFNPVIEIKL